MTHSPNPISPAANANHQNFAGRTRARKMTSPAITAAIPHRQRRPLRIKIAPRAVNSSQHMREAVLICSFTYTPRTCAGR